MIDGSEQIGDLFIDGPSAALMYWGNREKKQKGSGGLFSITVNPYTCKGCALCVTVCEDNALKMVAKLVR